MHILYKFIHPSQFLRGVEQGFKVSHKQEFLTPIIIHEARNLLPSLKSSCSHVGSIDI